MYLLAISGVKPNERCVCVMYLLAISGVKPNERCVCVSLASNLLVPAYLRAQKGIWL